MNLKTYNWNNGTQSSPIVLTDDQIKKLVAIGQKEGLETNVQGWITTSSRKIKKFLKYSIERQFPKLNIIYDEELIDSFKIQTSSNIIKEGTSELIIIDTDTGITHEFLKWKYEYSDFVIDGDISEQNIKDRIRIENGVLIVDSPKENASWSVTLKLTAYPIYIEDSELDSLPITSKSDIILTIKANKIEDIALTVKEEFPINSKVEIKVTPVPENSTKLKGARYTYSTNTPETVNINTSSLGTEIITKKQGKGTVIVTLHACNDTITRSNNVSFNVYGLKPVCFIIDQRSSTNISDPSSMVSENCILNSDGTLTSISNSGKDGDPNINTLTWIRQNSHLYVSRYVGFSGIRLKQLSDNNRKMFNDGTSSANYISNESGEYDVFLKFGSDIYYKTEPWIPNGSTVPNNDYVLVTIAIEIPNDDLESNWQKWSQYHLIGVYKACKIKNKLHSLSGKRPINIISKASAESMTNGRGVNFKLCNYEMSKLFCFLFYGYYRNLNCQQVCGYGTNNLVNVMFNPKLTGLTDDLGMEDTTTETGTGLPIDQLNTDDVIAGFGEGIKSVNFWGIENLWGDIEEHMSNVKVMEAYNIPNSINPSNSNIFVTDYIDEGNSVLVCKYDGTLKTYTSKEAFIEDYPYCNNKFLAILNTTTNNIARLIDTEEKYNKSGYNKKLMFGPYADVIVKEYSNSNGVNLYFCDKTLIASAAIARRSGHSDSLDGGINCFYCWDSASYSSSNIGTRIIFEGNENIVHIIDDETETL